MNDMDWEIVLLMVKVADREMKGIQRIREAIEAGESMTTEDIVLSFLEECALRDIETREAWEALQRFLPRLKAILESEKAAKERDSLTAKS